MSMYNKVITIINIDITMCYSFYLAEVIHNGTGEECKERRIGANETPVCLQGLWPQNNISKSSETETHEYRFVSRSMQNKHSV